MNAMSVDVAMCQKHRHHFKTIWSDKEPLKIHLICLTCSDVTGQSAFVAYGESTKSWGPWRKLRIEREVECPS